MSESLDQPKLPEQPEQPDRPKQPRGRWKMSRGELRARNRRARADGSPQRKLGNLGGRPRKLDQVDTVALIADIAAGVPITIACRAVGVDSERTFQNWLDKYPEFGERLAQEKRRVILEELKAIRSGTKDSEFRGRVWFLERVYKDFFAPPLPNAPAFGVQQNFTITYEKAREIEAMRTELLPGIEKRLGLTDAKTNGEEVTDGQG